MKHIHWTLLLCLAGVLVGLGQPGTDAPDTAFNETDAPTYVAYPALPRLSLSSPRLIPVAALELTLRQSPAAPQHIVERASTPVQGTGSRDLQQLLCTFLI